MMNPPKSLAASPNVLVAGWSGLGDSVWLGVLRPEEDDIDAESSA